MRSNSCDVLVVGGGPAGLAAAIALSMRGADVLVADAAMPPIDKACGEGPMLGAIWLHWELSVNPVKVRHFKAYALPIGRRMSR